MVLAFSLKILVPFAGIQPRQQDVVGMAKLCVDDDASCIIIHACQPCLQHR